jgi:methylenetetrahydrofolate reductase (NADPH)
MSLPIEEIITSLQETLEAVPPRVSFEFFPPKTAEMEEKLWQSVSKLAPLNPQFVSVTYGAGGSTRERTHSTVKRILHDTALKPAAHLTCVGVSRAEMDAIATEYWQMGVRHIVALRGDAPDGAGGYQPHPDGYAYASDLVAGLKKIGDFEISVAAYPEKHPEAVHMQADMDSLKRKIDAGANRAITQYFFDTGTYLAFLENAARNHITVPIIPGILPVTNFKQLVAFSARCGTTIPAWMANLFDGLDDDPQTRQLVAAIVAVEQCRTLRKAGIDEFHFYTLNRSDLTQAICHILGVRDKQCLK